MATVKCTIGSVRGQNQRWEMGSVPAGGNRKEDAPGGKKMVAWKTPAHLGGYVDGMEGIRGSGDSDRGSSLFGERLKNRRA